jgi:hypothetical protein
MARLAGGQYRKFSSRASTCDIRTGICKIGIGVFFFALPEKREKKFLAGSQKFFTPSIRDVF